MNAAFAGYVAGWTDLNTETLAKFLCRQGADIFYSRFIRRDTDLVGSAYMNRTGNVLRVGAMGIVPEARGTGAANRLLQHLLGEARSRGDKTMMLEVIQQNPPAVALYRRHGFQELGGLFGWRHAADLAPDTRAASSFEEIPVLDALRRPMVANYPEIPWPISPHAIAKVERTRAYAIDDACVIISDPGEAPIRVHGLSALPNEWLKLRSLLLAVMTTHTGGKFFAPPVWPEEFGREIFEPLGFVREDISQFLMRYDL